MAQKYSNKASCAVVLSSVWPMWAAEEKVFMVGVLSGNGNIVRRVNTAYYEYSYQNYE